MATAMDPFSMFMLTTGPAFLKNDESIINAVVRNSYLLPRFMEGKDADFLLQGGTQIQDIIYLNEDSDAEFYKSDQQDFSYRNQQVGTQWNAPWRFLKNSTSWTDHEVGLNESGSLSDRIGRFHRFKRIQRLKFMNLWTTQIHKMEDGLFATPNNAQMEDGSGALPYSLFAFITGNSAAHSTTSIAVTNGGLPVQGPGTAWTTVQGIAPSTTAGTAGSRWRNQIAHYVMQPTQTDRPENFWTGMRELHTKCRFERLPRFGSFSEPTRSPAFYAVSLWGMILAESCMRNQQDAYLAGRQDPAYPAPMFHGVPFVHCSGLNSAKYLHGFSGTLAYDEQGVDHTGAAATDNLFQEGPRVLAINGQVLNLIMHRDRVFYRVPPFSPDRQPFLKVMVTDTWYNLVCQNRRELGMLAPYSTTVGDDMIVPAKPSVGV